MSKDAIVGRMSGRASATRSWAALLAGFVVALVAALLLASPAAATVVPATAHIVDGTYVLGGGTIAAYDADGNAVKALYYDRVGNGVTAYRGTTNHRVEYFSAPGEGGPRRESAFDPQIGVDCDPNEPWPLTTVPEPLGYQCWTSAINPDITTPGVVGTIMPPWLNVEGPFTTETQVFDEWQVSGVITDGHCRTGDMGFGNPHSVFNDLTADGFEGGPEFGVWTDYNDDRLGMTGTINARYARVSPDTSPPLVTIDRFIDCAVVEQGTTTLLASYTCVEPANLGSGVATCAGQDDQGPVASGAPLDTSTVGTHSITVTGVDQAGNERSRTMHYTVEEANDAPTALALSPATVLEGKPAGTEIGTFTTTDEDVGDTFRYSLVDGDGSAGNESFSIDVDGDTLKTAETFDREAKSSYSIRVRTTDQGGKWFEQTFTVTVGNVDEPTLANNTVAENEPAGTIVGKLDDEGGFRTGETYELVPGPGDTDNGSFSIIGVPRPGSPEAFDPALATAESFDYEAKRTYSIRVRWVFSDTSSAEGTLTIHVTNVFESPAVPRGATPLRVSLVPSFSPCTAPNRTHGPPLDSGSCAPPVPASSELTVGTPDSNGAPANSVSSVRLAVETGSDTIPADDADVRIAASITDVRNRSDLSDYTGQVQTVLGIRLTDGTNIANGNAPQTTGDFSFRVKVPCVSTGNTAIGSSCTLNTTADTLVPGVVPEGERSAWALAAVHVYDAGPDQNIDTLGDNAVFMTQGVFVP